MEDLGIHIAECFRVGGLDSGQGFLLLTREGISMKGHFKRRWKQLVVAGAVTALVAGMGSTLPSAFAGGTIKADDDKWISIGMGIRTSFNA
ncbi:MAG: hypothetical protein CV089_11350, partial [Nitrospira sp. WS110]|nr:hypothetical protein [Nitrospira sp. WS110]